ncbi:MAG TPA: hypothetical protein VF792_01125 [Ktedonobacterales bacterium]
MGPNDPNYPQQPDFNRQPTNGQGSDYPTPPEPRFPPSSPQYPPYQQYPQQYGGQQPYGQQQYPGGPGYPGQQPPRRRSNAGLIAGIIGGVVLLCIVVCAVGVYAFRNSSAATSILTYAHETETAKAGPTPTATMLPEKVLYQDSLTDSPDGWANDHNCNFQSDGYHVVGTYYCLGPDAAKASDVDIKVTVNALKTGQNTGYGIVLRHSDSGNFYTFEISPDGQWAFYKIENDSNATPIQAYKSSTAIKVGTNTSNDLRVVAIGAHFTFFVNGQQVGAADDSTYTTGLSGVSNDDTNTDSQVVFTNFAVLQPNP